jgi:hypothetical protein
MMYARDPDGTKILATRGANGCCPVCKEPLVAKCGELVVHHWSHKARPDCDSWYEPETEWHRGWKQHWAPDQVEVVIGPHRADVLVDGTVIEFQHSSISTTEIREREDFYTREVGNMIWVFDAQPYRSRLDIHRRPNRQASFIWNHWRPSHGACRQPVFWDFGPDTMLRIHDFQPGPPTRGHGGYINPGAFMAWYGVTPLPERKPREVDE